ncbi:hypothetical protein RQP46_006673 [Phenoliferia psychrophenolica]
MTAPPPDAFPSTELSRSLSEVSWGITSHSILPAAFCAPGEARASLSLLEAGDTALIAVSTSGWKVCLRSVVDYGRLPPDSAAKDDQVFETLDHLLAYLSPAFEKKRMEVLSDQLENISVRKDWSEGEDGDGLDEPAEEDVAKVEAREP